MIPGMGEGSRVEERIDLLDGSPKGLGTDEARETEHAGVAQLAPAAGDQCLPRALRSASTGQRSRSQDRLHDGALGSGARLPHPYSQLSSNGYDESCS